MENARAKGRQIGSLQVSKEDIPASFLRHYPARKNGQRNISELADLSDISRIEFSKQLLFSFLLACDTNRKPQRMGMVWNTRNENEID